MGQRIKYRICKQDHNRYALSELNIIFTNKIKIIML